MPEKEGKAPLRMGRIGYLNVLPIYHPLESGILPHDYDIISGPPAVLNTMMARGELHVSSNSCFEYARHPEQYYLIEDLSIGSRGPVMSVLLLSRVPVERLDGKMIGDAVDLGDPAAERVMADQRRNAYVRRPAAASAAGSLPD